VGFPRESDASGQVTFEHIGPATYSAEFRGPNVWPTKTLVEAKENPAIQTVELRRVGDLVFSVLDQSGNGRAGLYVHLESLDLNQSAEEWITEGKLLTSPPSTTTDGAGNLTFPTIPRGAYRWAVLQDGVELSAGQTDLAAGERKTISIELP
jgi:hypothetical protein